MTNNRDKKIDTQHMPCLSCDSSDAMSINPKTGWGKCHSCEETFSPKVLKEALGGDLSSVSSPDTAMVASASSSKIKELPVDFPLDWADRRISKTILKKYQVRLGTGSDKFIAQYPMFHKGEHIGNKFRNPGKEFPQQGDTSKFDLFGMQAFPAGGDKYLTITEGQDDAMAACQMMGGKYACISVHGSSSVIQDIRRNFDYVNSFDNIILCLDNDEPGQKAAKKIASMGFDHAKVKIVTLKAYKDASDYLKNGKAEQFKNEWWKAEDYQPEGIKLGSDLWEDINDRKDSFQVPYPFQGLNDKTYGLRLSEMTTLTADTGIGKTTLLKEIEYSLLTNKEIKEKGYGVGFLHLEEPNGDTGLGLLSIHNSTPYHLPDVPRPPEDLRRAYDEVLNNNRVVIWDHFGSNTVDALLDTVTHMYALGCRYIVLDHLSIVVSDQSGDERKQLDEIATKLKTLCMRLNICLICVIHTNRQGQIRGTAGVEQLSNIVLRIERDKTAKSDSRRNTTKITVEKNRFCGRTGPGCYLFYDEGTGRMREVEDREAIEAYEEKNDGTFETKIEETVW